MTIRAYTCRDCGKHGEHCGARGCVRVRCDACKAASRLKWPNGRTDELKCKRCGQAFIQNGRRGRVSSFCSSRCRNAGRIHKPVQSTCNHCGCGVVGQSRRKYCDACLPMFKPPAERFTCKSCGAQFTKKGGRTQLMFCSQKCWADSRRIPQSEKDFLQYLDNIIRNARAARRLAARQQREDEARRNKCRKKCRCCECVFIVDADCGLKFRRFCSIGCRKDAKAKWRKRRQKGNRKHTARAKKRGLPRQYSITLPKVAERDAWLCKLCGKPVSNVDDRQSARAPCIDHIVPLNMPSNTRHGHTWDNVQLAHRECNEAKGCTIACRSLLECDNPRDHVASASIDQRPPR